MEYLKLENLSSYTKAFALSNIIWEEVSSWNYFAKDTVGKQLVRAADSVSANIAEGFGRYYKKDKILFYRYAKGSLEEVYDWINKARHRKLISKEVYDKIKTEMEDLPKEILHLIKYTNEKLKI